MLKLVIIDFDDTITDNRYLDFASFNYTCRKFNFINPISLKKFTVLRRNNYNARQIVKLFKNSTSSNFSEYEFLDLRKSFLLSNKSNNFLRLKPGTKSMLKIINKNKVPLCLCTVRQNREIVVNFLKKQKIQQYFNTVICKSDCDPKIDNTISVNRILLKSSLLKKLIGKFNFKSNEILYVGNSHEDFIAASNHKLIFLKINNDYLPNERLKFQLFANNMEDAKKIISNLLINYE